MQVSMPAKGAMEIEVIRKATWRLLPFLMLAYFIAFVDRVNSGFAALRSSLPMNLRFRKPGFTVWSSAQADIDRITSIWRECLTAWKGPYLFGKKPTIADAMYAPVVTRFVSYDVAVDDLCKAYGETIMKWAPMKEWIDAAKNEPWLIASAELDQ